MFPEKERSDQEKQRAEQAETQFNSERQRTEHLVKYHIEIKPGAEQDLEYYSRYVQKIIVKAVLDHLQTLKFRQRKRNNSGTIQ